MRVIQAAASEKGNIGTGMNNTCMCRMKKRSHRVSELLLCERWRGVQANSTQSWVLLARIELSSRWAPALLWLIQHNETLLDPQLVCESILKLWTITTAQFMVTFVRFIAYSANSWACFLWWHKTSTQQGRTRQCRGVSMKHEGQTCMFTFSHHLVTVCAQAARRAAPVLNVETSPAVCHHLFASQADTSRPALGTEGFIRASRWTRGVKSVSVRDKWGKNA